MTLIEILVVVGVIGILAIILVPIGKNSIERANTAGCLNNLRQLTMASIQYSGDNSGKLVPMATGTPSEVNGVKTWRALILPYIADDNNMKLFRCPSDKLEKTRKIEGFQRNTGLQPTSYGINSTYYYGVNGQTLPYPGYHDYFDAVGAGFSGTVSKRLMTIPAASRTIFLSDIGKPDNLSAPLTKWTEKNRTESNANFGYARMPFKWTVDDYCLFPRHAGGKVNVSFYDGHAETLDVAQALVAHPPGDPDCLYDYH